jgi:hypothetical protein
MEASEMKKLVLLALVAILLPNVAMAQGVKQGDPAIFFPIYLYGWGDPIELVKGETWCYSPYVANFYWESDNCNEMGDTFATVTTQTIDPPWPVEHTFHTLHPGGGLVAGGAVEGDDAEGVCVYVDESTSDPAGYWYYRTTICVTVPCDATIGATNTMTITSAYCEDIGGEMTAVPDSGDCDDPNAWASQGIDCYSNEYANFLVVESPPALYILQDSLYFVEQGQTAAYVPFSICNGDPCAPPTDYVYVITSTPNIGGTFPQTDTAFGVSGGTCTDVYAVVDAGTATVCDLDTLTIVVWASDGSVYDTCVQLVHVIEPIPVPLFTAPVVTIMVLAMILAAAVIMKRHAVSKA